MNHIIDIDAKVPVEITPAVLAEVFWQHFDATDQAEFFSCLMNEVEKTYSDKYQAKYFSEYQWMALNRELGYNVEAHNFAKHFAECILYKEE